MYIYCVLPLQYPLQSQTRRQGWFLPHKANVIKSEVVPDPRSENHRIHADYAKERIRYFGRFYLSHGGLPVLANSPFASLQAMHPR